MLEKILIPTDLSAESNSIFPIGVTLAQAFNSRLYLVHVMHPDSLKEPEQLGDFPRLSKFFATDRGQPDLPPLKATVPVGKVYRYHEHPDHVILDFAKRKAVDLICMATTPNTRSKLTGWLNGGMTARILKEARCSVLCLRGHPVKEKDWVRPRFKHILLLTELGARGAAPLLKALPWAHTFNSMLHIFPLLLDDSEPSPDANPLREIAKINPAQTNVLLFANPNRRTRNLMDFVKRTTVDLIIVPPRARRELSTPFFRDIVQELLNETQSPVLVLR
jgi:nucleotide-binding universal stress UspA family protein